MYTEEDEKSFIKLSGSYGEFNTPKSNFKVRYFSTFANDKGQHADLLGELKPMRERVSTKDLPDMNSLLQRDLDDLRVHNGLIPYLKNSIFGENDPNHIAFFPAILCVLIPSDFLTSSEEKEYPKTDSNPQIRKIPYPTTIIDDNGQEKEGKAVQKNYIYNYKLNGADDKDSYWKLELINNSRYGTLHIDIKNTHVVVLDGQHRANAFRVITNTFFKNNENNIYSKFYGPEDVLKDYSSDLPVTVIWFEPSDENQGAEINPKIISRDIFTAVNNNAKPISKSRNILLDDKDPVAIYTRYYFSKHGFKLNENATSLLHLGFDINTSLSKGQSAHVFTITTPEILFYVNRWLFFGARTSYWIENQYNINTMYQAFSDKDWVFGKTVIEHNSLMPKSDELNLVRISVDEETETSVRLVKQGLDIDSEQSPLKSEWEENIYPLIKACFESFLLYRPHYQATLKLQQERESAECDWDSKVITAWDDIYNGGEGLFYTFHSVQMKNDPKGKDYVTACGEIEKKFKKIRAEFFSDHSEKEINELYGNKNGTFTKAFQTGLVMAALLFKEEVYPNESMEEAMKQFHSRIENKISLNKWVYFFNVFKPKFFQKGAAPKLWPTYQKLILRLIQNGDEFFNKEDDRVWYSPEAKYILDNFLDSAYNHCDSLHSISGWKDIQMQMFEDESLFIDWLDKIINQIKVDFDYLEVGHNLETKRSEWNDFAINELKKKIGHSEDEDEDEEG